MRHLLAPRIADHDVAERRSERVDDRMDGGGEPAPRIAVHFWPAFTVISCTTSLTNSSKSACPLRVGPEDRGVERIAFGVKRIDLRDDAGCDCSSSAVLDEPVNEIASWQSR